MRKRLKRLMRGRRVDAAVALRARMISMLADAPCVSTVAARLGVDPKTVRLWRKRFLDGGLKGLHDKVRAGRPRRITDVTRCELIAMACGRPKLFGIPYRKTWTFDTLHEAYRAEHPEVQISRTSVLRVLNSADLRPHRMQGWLHSPDPEFRAKATEICSLYLNPPAGAVVLSVDEKTGMQALKRRNPTKWSGCGRPGRYEFEYKRMGTCTLLAAFNTQTGQVFAEVMKTRKAKDLLGFMKRLAKQYPKGDVHIVWDNLNIHHEGRDARWTEFNKRHGGRFYFHYTPIHASWVNQVELFFSRVQRRVLRYGSFESVAELAGEVLGYIDHWNKRERKPYRWTFRGYPLEEARSAA
jgi:transposase